MSVLNFRLLAGSAALLATLSSNASAQEWKPGQIVLGSPTTIEAGYRRCQVMGGPDANGYYDMNCMQFYVDHRGKKVRTEGRTRVSRKWIKPDDPSFQPDMQFAAVGAAAAPKGSVRPAQQPAAPASAGGAAKPGSYHCVFFINGMLQTVPGFTLTAGGYRHQNGGGGTTRRKGDVIEFVGGPLNGQAGKVGPKTIHLYNESRSRTVIDCDSK